MGALFQGCDFQEGRFLRNKANGRIALSVKELSVRAASHSGIARQRSGNLGYKYSKQAMQFCEIKMAFGRLGIDAVPFAIPLLLL